MTKPRSALRLIFGKQCTLTHKAKQLFVILSGIERLLGTYCSIEQIPRIGGQDPRDLLIELSDAGYVLGTPTKYELNLKKLKMRPKFSTKEPEPKVLQIIREFQKQSKAYRKQRATNAEKDMIQLRFLIRNYNGYEVQKMIVPFFTDKKTVARKGQVTVNEFFNFALFRLGKQFGKPQHQTEELGVTHRKKHRN